jgi:hypothetical protein
MPRKKLLESFCVYGKLITVETARDAIGTELGLLKTKIDKNKQKTEVFAVRNREMKNEETNYCRWSEVFGLQNLPSCLLADKLQRQ